MKQWVNRKLREVGTIERGRSRHRPRYAFHLYNGPYPFIQTGEVRAASKYISSYENTYSEDGLKQSKLWPKGTLCITIAANIAELAILDFDACFPDSILGFIPDTTKTNIDYVFYTLSHYQRRLKHIGEGSVQDNINLGTFEDIEFPFPPIAEQKAIASVLSSLDDKIDLLHRQNKTLESMAETLFRQLFYRGSTR
ncbi:restriction endonuclease subunit S [Erwinia aphidicola]|nr:restriction endonuclease subunit S [Erwinia aphidicola]